ncbi:hypothetical protein CN513_14185 [Bacillus cereus]|uniref:hypothetical protein n=1 Tax=Bacillus cereus group TaxID=86661 RepID=UPI000BF38573|nr:hypothetical protein [Bacillus cereus]PET17559.1 hypothetical protein CN513_14185 [Bacillus cereus]PEV54080.1 hypothetical protein CN422_29485 [Bacillus cereus]PFQ53005.1 hypothetical protein COK24_17610 [Bacillus cereus]
MSKKRKDVEIKVTTKGTFNATAFAEAIASLVKRDLLDGKTRKQNSKKTPKPKSPDDNRE